MKNLPAYIDIAFCLIILPMMAMIFPVERWFHNFQWYVITVGIWLYLLYFINRAFTVPLLFKESKKRWIGISLIAISFAVTYWLSQITLYIPKPNIHDEGIFRMFPSIMQYQQAVWSLFMIVETFSFAIGLLIQANLQKSRHKAVEAERNKAALELYKAQIKPHFMFNTLNSLYGLFLIHDDKALEALEKYISMLRYLHTSSLRDSVNLSDEADYIRQYVALQSLRLNEMTSVTLNIDIESRHLHVPPMLLVTFVENCFKHGISPVEKSDISIAITEKNGKFDFSTVNRIFHAERFGEQMGIKNCRKRLELLYPGKHVLDIRNDGILFHANLHIDLSL